MPAYKNAETPTNSFPDMKCLKVITENLVITFDSVYFSHPSSYRELEANPLVICSFLVQSVYYTLPLTSW